MRILLIAPDQPGINAIPEIRVITAAHTTHVLNGPVTIKDIYAAVSANEYDIIHFAGHIRGDYGELDELQLSNGEYMDLDSATRMAKLGKAKLVLFNICLASRFATFMIRNGVPCVVFTTVEIEDYTAWELPCTFYEECRRAERLGTPLDFKRIFDTVDSGDGRYSIIFSQDSYISMFQLATKPMWTALEELKRATEQLAGEVATAAERVDRLEESRGRIPTWVFVSLLLVAALLVAGNLIIVAAFLQGGL